MGESQLVVIRVDTNDIVRDGLTRASLRRLTDDIHAGDNVIAHDVAEAANFSAVVVAVMETTAHLRLDWESAQPWDSPH